MTNNKQLTKGNKMRKIAMIVGLLSILASNANAGWSYSQPNIFGGYNYYTNNGNGYSQPNIFGGYNYYGSLFN